MRPREILRNRSWRQCTAILVFPSQHANTLAAANASATRGLTRPPSMPKCKRRRPSQIQELLGVVCNVSQAHAGSVHYSPKPTRCTKVLRELEAASKSKLTNKQRGCASNSNLFATSQFLEAWAELRPSHSTGGLNPDPWTGGRHAHLKRGQLNWSQLCSSSK